MNIIVHTLFFKNKKETKRNRTEYAEKSLVNIYHLLRRTTNKENEIIINIYIYTLETIQRIAVFLIDQETRMIEQQQREYLVDKEKEKI